jgi:hypothetical protein
MASPEWGDGYDAGHADATEALPAPPGWQRTPRHPLPADLPSRCAWLRGYSAGIKAAVNDAMKASAKEAAGQMRQLRADRQAAESAARLARYARGDVHYRLQG